MRWLTEPSSVGPGLRERLINCWRDVSNAGGAVGFPYLPVTAQDVAPVADEMLGSLDMRVNRLLVAEVEDDLAGWLFLVGNERKVTEHWARVLRLQTSLAHRGRGVGAALMREVARAAAQDFHLEHLHLEVRAGVGLEPFYERLGWRVVGRWPAALRIAEGDDRDEVLMFLALPARPADPA